VPGRSGTSQAWAVAGGVLEREGYDVLGRGADEGDAACGAGSGEGDIFAEESVAGMDGLGAGCGGGGEDGVEGEIALRGGGFADEDGFVGIEDVERVFVGGGIDGDGAYAHALEGAFDAAGDGAAICDEDFLKHARSCRLCQHSR